MRFRQQRLEDSTRHFEKALALEENNLASAGMLITCYTTLGDKHAAGGRRSAEIALARAEEIRRTTLTMARRSAMAVWPWRRWAGTNEQKSGWTGVLLDRPRKHNHALQLCMRLANDLKDKEAALEMLGSVLEKIGRSVFDHLKVDPDMACIRDDPTDPSDACRGRETSGVEKSALRSRTIPKLSGADTD